MNKRIVLIAVFLIFFLEVVAVYWFKFGFDNVLLRETLYLIPPFFAIISGVVALRAFGFESSRSITLLLLTAGVSFLFFGELLFNYYNYILHIDPYPSAADMFFLLSYPLIFLGLMNEVHIAQVAWKNIAKPVLFLFGAVALLLSSIIGYFGIYKALKPDESFIENVVAMSYGVGDLLLILVTFLLLVLVREFRGSKLSRVLLLLFIGFLFILIADILFGMYRSEYSMEVWFYKSLLDSFWMAGYILFALALFEFSFSLQDTYKKAVLNAQERGLPPAQPPAAVANPVEQKTAMPVVSNQEEKVT